MNARSASLLAVALACLPAPAFAQDGTGDAIPEGEAPEATAEAPSQSAPASAEPASAALAPATGELEPTAARAIAPAAIPTAAYMSPERAATIERCRSAYVGAGGAAATAVADCEAQLQQYERTNASVAQAPGATEGPVMWVRVPIARQTAAAAPVEAVEPEAGE